MEETEVMNWIERRCSDFDASIAFDNRLREKHRAAQIDIHNDIERLRFQPKKIAALW